MFVTDEPWGSPRDLLSLDRLYEAHHRQALGLAFRMLGNRDDAEDVVQEAFLTVWRTLDTYDADRGSTRAWILTIVRSRAIDQLRRRQRRFAEPLDDSLASLDASSVEDQAAVEFEASRTRAAVASL